MGGARAAHPASAAWCSITTRRGGLGRTQIEQLFLGSMAKWAWSQVKVALSEYDHDRRSVWLLRATAVSLSCLLADFP